MLEREPLSPRMEKATGEMSLAGVGTERFRLLCALIFVDGFRLLIDQHEQLVPFIGR